jgi:hypothetical protein
LRSWIYAAVQTDQAVTTKGKNVVISDDLKLKMIKPKSLEVSVWKVNERKRVQPVFKPTSEFLLNKYTSQWKRNEFQHLRDFKRPRLQNGHEVASMDRREGRWTGEVGKREDCAHAESRDLFSQPEFPKWLYLETERKYGVWSRLGRSVGSRPRAVAIPKGLKELRLKIQKKWSPRNPTDARGLRMGKKFEGALFLMGKMSRWEKAAQKS